MAMAESTESIKLNKKAEHIKLSLITHVMPSNLLATSKMGAFLKMHHVHVGVLGQPRVYSHATFTLSTA